jgi:hypothetical protein
LASRRWRELFFAFSVGTTDNMIIFEKWNQTALEKEKACKESYKNREYILERLLL